jgi:hypothetical protein
MRRKFLAILLLALSASTAFGAWTERYVSVAGAGAHDGTSAGNAWTLAEAITNAAAGQRINVINDTYSNTTTDRTFANAGSDSTAIWWRGYNTAIGDIDSDNTLTKPLISFTTGFMTVSGANNWFSNIRVTGADTTVTEGVVRVTAPNTRFWRCRFEGTAADADCKPWEASSTGDNAILYGCYFVSNALANCCVCGDDTFITGCVFENGLSGVVMGGGPCTISNSLFINQAAHCVSNITVTSMIVIGNSFYSPAGDGVEMAGATSYAQVVNNIFDDCGVYAVNCAGGVSANVHLFNNSFYDSGTADLNNVYESNQVGNITESASPFTNAAGGDFTLDPDSLSAGAGFPGTLENSSGEVGYRDLGALQREVTGASNVIDPLTGTIPGL